MVSPLFLQGVIIPPPAEIKVFLLLTLFKNHGKIHLFRSFLIKMQMEQGQTPATLPVVSVVYAHEN